MAPPTGTTLYTFRIQGAREIIRSVREAPPAHLQFEIQSFTSLKTSIGRSKLTYIESAEFEAAGYKWILVIYPYGNNNDDGADHISLYLKLMDELDHGCSLDASCKFFVYDYRRKIYLTIQGLTESRYDAMDKEKGIARALPLSDLVSASNGFLQGGRCMFGVEVFVADTVARATRLSILNERKISVYTWPIQEFSQIKQGHVSDTFTMEGRIWKLQIYPRGNLSGKDKSLSLYLNMVDYHDLTNGKKMLVDMELRVKDLLNGNDAIATSSYTRYSTNCASWGLANFLPVSDLHNSNKGFIIDDTVIVEVKLNLMMLLHDI